MRAAQCVSLFPSDNYAGQMPGAAEWWQGLASGSAVIFKPMLQQSAISSTFGSSQAARKLRYGQLTEHHTMHGQQCLASLTFAGWDLSAFRNRELLVDIRRIDDYSLRVRERRMVSQRLETRWLREMLE